jgi:Domain of unknown function (DUF222)
VNGIPTFSSTAEALGTLRAAMSFLAAADATAMPVARASVLRAFNAGQGYCGDGEYSAKTWLVHKTRVSRGAAAGQVAWALRAAAHPVIAAALGEAVVSQSWARVTCQQSERLPAGDRDEADAILLAAVAGGAVLEDLAALGQRMYEMSRSATPDRDGAGDAGGSDDAGSGDRGAGGAGDGEDGAGASAGDEWIGAGGGTGGGGGAGPVFDDRSVRLATTFGGAAVLAGDLTPECAAAVEMVLDALPARAGAEDTRTREQRRHDALAEAMRSLGFCIVICVTLTIFNSRGLVGYESRLSGSRAGRSPSRTVPARRSSPLGYQRPGRHDQDRTGQDKAHNHGQSAAKFLFVYTRPRS